MITDLITDRLQRCVESATRQGATAAKVSLTQGEDTSTDYQAGRLKSVEVREQVSYTIRRYRK